MANLKTFKLNFLYKNTKGKNHSVGEDICNMYKAKEPYVECTKTLQIKIKAFNFFQMGKISGQFAEQEI